MPLCLPSLFTFEGFEHVSSARPQLQAAGNARVMFPTLLDVQLVRACIACAVRFFGELAASKPHCV